MNVTLATQVKGIVNLKALFRHTRMASSQNAEDKINN